VTRKDRLKAHRHDGFDTVELLLPGLPCLAAPELEKAVLKVLWEAGYRPVRGREYFSITAKPLVLRIVNEFADEHGLNLSAFRKAALKVLAGVADVLPKPGPSCFLSRARTCAILSPPCR
jgi:hypothetical protein